MIEDGKEMSRVQKDGEDEMTVVVPPPKSSKLSTEPGKSPKGYIEMDNSQAAVEDETAVDSVDPKTKAISGTSICPSFRFFH